MQIKTIKLGEGYQTIEEKLEVIRIKINEVIESVNEIILQWKGN